MQITPLYRHAAMRLPALTSLFSDALAVTDIDVVSGGTTTITTSAVHGVTIGEYAALSITDALTPNPVTAAVKVGVTDDWTITTQYDHGLTTTPDVLRATAWDASTVLDGFTDAEMNGTLQLVSVTDRNTFVVRPSALASLTLNTNEAQLKSLEFAMVGWHRAVWATTTTLTFPTPAAVTRSYTVLAPTVARNIRVMGSVSLDLFMRKYVLDDASINDNTMFICPRDSARVTSKVSDDRTRSGATVALNARVEDGFDVYVLLPAHTSNSGVAAVDLAHGDILRAVLRTFNGLNLPRSEFGCGNTYGAYLDTHGIVNHHGPTYVHQYSFSANADLSNDDMIKPYEQADLPAIGSDSVQRVGAPAYRDIVFTGIAINGEPGLLTLDLKLDQ